VLRRITIMCCMKNTKEKINVIDYNAQE